MVIGLAATGYGQDEAPGQQIVYTGVKLPANGYSCGRATYPIYCYGIPADDGGTFWLDVYWNSYPKPTGFISWQNVADLGQASVTAATITRNSNGQVSQLDITFNGLTNDGDNDSYSGVATFTFSYVKMTGGSGRGGGYPGWLMYVTGYTMTITYN
jgi:hypothetical protein